MSVIELNDFTPRTDDELDAIGKVLSYRGLRNCLVYPGIDDSKAGIPENPYLLELAAFEVEKNSSRFNATSGLRDVPEIILLSRDEIQKMLDVPCRDRRSNGFLRMGRNALDTPIADRHSKNNSGGSLRLGMSLVAGFLMSAAAAVADDGVSRSQAFACDSRGFCVPCHELLS